jgi:uncharacterized protein (DUF302 family)
MNTVAVEQNYVIPEKFDKALKLIRTAIADMELEIAGELDMAHALYGEPAGKTSRCRILLVDCPVLMFEALALNRAAAVFIPLHVLVSAAGSQTHVSLLNPAALFDARLPAGAADPLEKLQARVARALHSASRSTETNQH